MGDAIMIDSYNTTSNTQAGGAGRAFSSRVTGISRLFRFASAGLIAVGVFAGSVPASAQDVSNELERLRRDLVDLQRFVYAGKAPSTSASSSTGDTGGVSNAVAGQLQIKLQKLERRLRELNGRFEEVDFKLRTMGEALERQKADQEQRLLRLEQAIGVAGGGQGGVVAPSTVGLANGLAPSGAGGSVQSLATGAVQAQGAAAGDASANGTTIVSSAGTQVDQNAGLQPGQQALGTLRLDANGNVVGAQISPQATQNATQPAAAPQPAPSPTAAPVSGGVGSVEPEAAASSGDVKLPEGTPKEQYDYALTLLLRKRDYAGAETALRQFVDANGGDPLAGAAMYWLGETYYVRENYRDAAAVFVDAFSNYPNSSKAADSLLKLGMSFGILKKTKAACTAFDTLKQKYPQAEARIMRTADAEAARYGCS